MKRCHRCQKELGITDRVGRAETCPSCGTDLRCCRNCAFYDVGSYNQCREPQAERVLEKERGNFCDYFFFRDSSRNKPIEDKKSDPKGKLESLFKK
jgi:threonine dehydrogenase-like Zn-dependent dehydrogenase